MKHLGVLAKVKEIIVRFEEFSPNFHLPHECLITIWAVLDPSALRSQLIATYELKYGNCYIDRQACGF